jgi:hypothetical protein
LGNLGVAGVGVLPSPVVNDAILVHKSQVDLFASGRASLAIWRITSIRNAAVTSPTHPTPVLVLLSTKPLKHGATTLQYLRDNLCRFQNLTLASFADGHQPLIREVDIYLAVRGGIVCLDGQKIPPAWRYIGHGIVLVVEASFASGKA